ncbi:MAG: FHA domain-containing protein, partial [Clostridia bacterium]|nr:FHA domain-containing protein [Clostridia bacterium]
VPNEDKPVVPNEDKPVVPNEDKPVVPNEDKPIVPNEGEAVPPNEGEPVTPGANDSEKKADLLQKLDKLPGGRKAAAIIAAVAVLAIAIGVIVIVKLGEKRKMASAVVPCEKTFFVRSVGKTLAGQEFVFLDEFRIGRNRALCELVLPMDAVGVGSVHCHIVCESGGVYLTDKDSCGGTYMADGTRLEPEKKYPLVNGSQFFVGNKNNAFIIYFNA